MTKKDLKFEIKFRELLKKNPIVRIYTIRNKDKYRVILYETIKLSVMLGLSTLLTSQSPLLGVIAATISGMNAIYIIPR